MPKRSSTSAKVFYPSFKLSELLALLKGRISELESLLPLKSMVLFGSWSAGRETAFSDIDLLVVYRGPAQEEAYKIVRRCLNLRGLEPHVYSEDEAGKLQPTLERMTKDGIFLFPAGKTRSAKQAR